MENLPGLLRLASVAILLAASAICGEPTKKPREITISHGESPFVAFNLADIAPDQLVALSLKITEVDKTHDFKPNTAQVTPIGGGIAWGAKNDEHVCDAESNQFPRQRQVYAVVVKGEWAGQGQGDKDIWTVTVFQVLIDGKPFFNGPSKLLATGQEIFSASVLPPINGEFAWTNAGGGQFSDPKKSEVTFTAPTVLAPKGQRNQQLLQVAFRKGSETSSVPRRRNS